MLGIFKLTEGRLGPLREIETDCWINLADPDAAEIAMVREKFNIPADFLDDALDAAERTRLQAQGGFLFMLARASCPTPENIRTPFITVPIGVIIGPDAVITVCRKPLVVEELLRGKLHGPHGRARIIIALTLLQQISITYVNHLQEIRDQTSAIEETMRRSMRNEELASMLHIQKTLVYFVTALKGNSGVLEHLPDIAPEKLNEEERALWLDAGIECKQAVETAEIYTQITGNMNEIFAAMISNNVNSVMKLLTGLTLILMAPSIVVGVFGMNVPIPLASSPLALPAITVGTLLFCLVLWRYLVHKDWM